MTDTTNLGLPEISGSQSSKYVTHNEALKLLDAVVQLSVKDRDLTAAPGSPSDGDRYIVASSATGDWLGEDGHVAAYQDGAWAFYVPKNGWQAWIEDEQTLVAWSGSAWAAVLMFGINTTADATNRLAVKSDAALFSHDDVTPGSGDVQVKLNKAATANTASFIYQTNWSARAEFGLCGDDDFHIKVSPDGSTFYEGLTISASSGFVAFNALFGSDVSFPTIASDVLTVSTSYAVPAPESGTTDDIDTISGGADGALLILTGTASNTLTFKDGTGNLKLGGDRVLDNFEDALMLVKRGSDWIEVSYANNG